MTDKNWFDEFHAIDLKPYVDTQKNIIPGWYTSESSGLVG